jgi:radical SAM superfamily enzyme YgiQ (UPF0313 family)
MTIANATERLVTRVQFVRLPPFMGFESHHPRDVTLPFTIAYGATLARREGHDVRVTDVWSTERTMEDVLAEIRTFDPEVIVFEAHAEAFPVVAGCAARVREFSRARRVAYGSVPTFLPERVVGPGACFDVAMAGESELTLLDLLAVFDAGGAAQAPADVDGIAFWDAEAGKLVRTRPRELPRDLDVLPSVDYELFRLEDYCKYSFPMPIHGRVRWGHVLATRGCPYPCTHCSFDHRQSYGRPLRRHSPRRLVDDLERLVRRHGVNAVSIEDDIFTLDRRYVLAICDELEARALGLRWVAQTRVDCLDAELVERMKRAGCAGLSLGIESGSDRVLGVLKKGFTRQEALDGIRLCQERGLMLRLLFMIGNPTETAAEIEDTLELARQARAITIQVHISTPYPGTSLLGKEEGDAQHLQDFSSYNTIVHNHSAVPDAELWALQKRFYRRYYFSRRYLATFARQRLRYLDGSLRRELSLAARALWYLVWTSRRQARRDVDGIFDHHGTRAREPRPSSRD